MDNILIRLNETDEHIIDRGEDRVFTDYRNGNKEIISIESLISLISDLVDEIDKLKEEISDLENQEEPIKDYYDYYGVSEHDFH